MMNNGRVCSRCHEAKEARWFHKDSSKPDGFYPVCKKCRGIRYSQRGDIHDRLEMERHITDRGCWEWTTHKTRAGYGRVLHESKIWLVHRLSYTLYVGPIPDGMLVCHRCDNPPCFNPAHLFIGDFKANAEDMVRKGRHRTNPRRGEMSPQAKLTADEVRAIRADKRMHKIIAAEYGIAKSTVSGIQCRTNWRHVA